MVFRPQKVDRYQLKNTKTIYNTLDRLHYAMD